MQNYQLTARAIIIHDWKILLVKHKWREYFSLPGGKLENAEKIEEWLKRELIEELWVEWEIWELLFINEFKFEDSEKRTIDFFLKVENWADFVWKTWEFAEKELDKIEWKDLNWDFEIKPDFLKEKLANLEKMKGIKI